MGTTIATGGWTVAKNQTDRRWKPAVPCMNNAMRGGVFISDINAPFQF
jgi:hypothetical protein